MAESERSRDEIEALLRSIHGTAVDDLEPIAGGYWSSAFSYRHGDRELILRLSEIRAGFEMDREAHAFARPELPVPEVIQIGQAFDGHYAISVRHHGRFVEDIGPGEAERAAPMVVDLLDALRTTAVASPDGTTAWSTVETGSPTWHAWLLAGLVDDPSRHVHGWRQKLAADPDLDRLFRTCEQRVGSLLEAVPERRDLVHSDLLHGNVLVDDDASTVTGIFSWKCATLGDFLYDTAWCTFWQPYFPGFGEVEVWDSLLRSLAGEPGLLTDAAVRHHCYELQIGAHHMGWYAWTDDAQSMDWLVRRLTEVLERGPR